MRDRRGGGTTKVRRQRITLVAAAAAAAAATTRIACLTLLSDGVVDLAVGVGLLVVVVVVAVVVVVVAAHPGSHATSTCWFFSACFLPHLAFLKRGFFTPKHHLISCRKGVQKPQQKSLTSLLNLYKKCRKTHALLLQKLLQQRMNRSA